MPPSPNLSELIRTKPLPVTAVAGCLTFQEPGLPTTVQGLPLGVSPCARLRRPPLPHLQGFRSLLRPPLPAWRLPWTLSSMGSQRVGHDRKTFTVTFQPVLPHVLIWSPKVNTRPDPRLLRISPLLVHFSPWTGHFHHLTCNIAHVFTF